MTGYLNAWMRTALAVAWRHLYKWIKVPANFVPTFIFPLVFFTSFAGALTRIGEVPGFSYEPGYTSFIFVFSLLQTCLFGGLATGFTIAGDFQSGFARRLMLVTRHRTAILGGYVISTFARAALMCVVVTAVASVIGLRLPGSIVEIAAMYLLALLLSVCGTFWAAGMMFRFRSPQVAPAMQIPMFTAIFLAPVYVPIGLLDGWLRTVARYNPISWVLEAGRSLLAGAPTSVGLAFGLIAGVMLVLGVWGVTGVRSAERAG